MPPPGACCPGLERLSCERVVSSHQKGCDQVPGAQSCWRAQRKIFGGHGILSSTPEDQAGFLPEMGQAPNAEDTGEFSDPETRNLGHWEELCLPGGGR